MGYPKFVIRKSSNGKFYFNLHAVNTKVIATSEMYESKGACENGIDSVKTNAPIAETDDQS
ncbi:YegP family protein [Winogradskyella luteola]|uniref:YegP family protein n=1 Tax=Winogradskyella luteola TaxID=2828330 RepID=A0A9X1F6A0_9FLAO|nr:YegP family protein [Winogradskyella luteola]MBV7268034.1 YegP family protein [Winogradskyella luteola]